MEFLFMDESGDNGLVEGSSDFYILAGISIEDRFWKEYFWKIQDFRLQISQKYGLKIDELKGSELFSHRGSFFNSSLTPYDLERVYHQIMDLICAPSSEIFVVVKSKEEFRNRHSQARIRNPVRLFNEQIWREYLSFYEKYMVEKSIKTQHPHTALIYFDHPGQEKYIRKIVREYSRKFDQQSEFPGAGIVEDVVFHNSKTSHFIQLAEVLAFSINRLVTGRGTHDVITIKRVIVEKLRSKLNEKIDFKKLPS